MSNAKSNAAQRLLAAILSMVMVLSVIPFSMVANAATTAHPDNVTVTVVDSETNEPVKGAKVSYTVYDKDSKSEVVSGTDELTDDNGEIAVLDTVSGNIAISKISVSHDDYEEYTDYAYDKTIASVDDNFVIELTCKKIRNVVISGKTLTYKKGEKQKLVSVTEISGDTVEYEIDGKPTDGYAMDAGTYNITVTVKRPGKDDYVETVTTVIEPAELDFDITPKTGLKYNGENQPLVELIGSFEENDTVTWKVDNKEESSSDIPERMAAGTYEVTLTVNRGPDDKNYNVFEKKVKVEIAPTEINIDGLKIEANENLVYNGEAQQLLKAPEGVKGYQLKYSYDGKTWFDDSPKETDAGDYEIYVKAVKDKNYNDKDTPYFPIKVTISKAKQEFKFNTEQPVSASLTKDEFISGKKFDFKAIDVNKLAGGEIKYGIEITDGDADIASIDDNGELTVRNAGIIKVSATLTGNNNYESATIEHTIEISAVTSVNGEWIKFENEFVPTYTVGAYSGITANKAKAVNKHDKGAITYSIANGSEYGLSIDNNGQITVVDYTKLIAAVSENNGKLSVTVRADKAAVEYRKNGNKFDADYAEYTFDIVLADVPEAPYTLSVLDGSNGWYKTAVTVTPAEGYSIAKTQVDEKGDNFVSSVQFDDQGENERYIYLRNIETGVITSSIAVVDASGAMLKIDSVNPTALNIQFSELNLIQKLSEKLGFYNPTVTITFSAEDATSGIDHFDWTYTPENGEPVTKEIAVTVEGNKAVATLVLPAEEAEQMHGKISFTATDKASNVIGKDNDYVFIVDTIAPELSVKYQSKEPYAAQEDSYNGAHYFNSDVSVELTVTETNFYAEDVDVKVAANGEAASAVTPSWNGNVGTFTLAGDGDYKVYVSYTDKSDNKMNDYISDTITVDKTAPIVGIEYIHNGDVQKTRFTVTERNFRASDIVITGTMKNINGEDIDFTAEKLTELLHDAAWVKNGDTYTFEYDAYVNGIYNIKMDYEDITGWNAIQSSNEFIIDHGAPSDVKIEYAKTPVDSFLEVITLGFYNPSITVRFTSYDESAGVESFTWGYTKEFGASTVNHPESIADSTIPAVQDAADKSKFTAEITLTADEVEQYRGYISVYATDNFKNDSNKKDDKGNIFVVDTVAPTLKVEYSLADREIPGEGFFYNKPVDVKLTVTEANFYPEDVVVSIAKDGNAFDYGTISWGTRNEEDKTVGVFTLPAPSDHSGDGDYVITVEYTDRSNNKMVTHVSATHTIDTTKPVIEVEYNNENVINKLIDRDGNERRYFADTQTAVVSIKEHNFIADEVNFTIKAKDVTGAELDVDKLNSKTAWSVDSTGDVHIITITYPGDANYTFDVDYTDKAENKADDYAADYFTVDKTAPTNLKVDYSTSILNTVLESLSFGFYNAKMTVTLTAEDPTSEVHSFLYSYLNAAGVSSSNSELINEAIQAADIKYSADRKTAVVTFEIPKMILGSDNQFNGTVEFVATDRAGNTTQAHKETKRIIVDNIAPTAQVSYNEATNVVGNVSYYNGDITATVKINEANFYADDVQIMVSKDGGTATAVAAAWRDDSVDVHTGTFTLTGDGDYVVTINYTDKSSNKMATYTSNQMTVDTKIEVPTYTINGVAKNEIGGAYKDNTVIGFSFEDQNFDTKNITLTRTRFDNVEDVTSKFINVNDNDKGGSGLFNIPSEVENDGIYVLKISMTDKAKHQTESQIKFTVNRFGSVYEYSDKLVDLIKDGGQYVTSVKDDLVITEYNADRLLENSLKILITRDGESIDVDYASNPENINAQVGIGESGWYQYVYTIKASNFEKDGVYKISLASAYSADDSAENASSSVPDNSIDSQGNKILDTMNFTVDSVAPEIRNVVNLDKKIADKDKIVDGKINIKYTVVDVGGLDSIEVVLNGKTIQSLTKKDIADNAYNFTGSFDIEEQDSTTVQKVRIKVVDLAGNVTDTDSEDFLKAHSDDNENSTYVFHNEITVSRNFFVRWYANTALFWGSIAGVVVLAGGIWFIVAAKRKKKEKNK